MRLCCRATLLSCSSISKHSHTLTALQTTHMPINNKPIMIALTKAMRWTTIREKCIDVYGNGTCNDAARRARPKGRMPNIAGRCERVVDVSLAILFRFCCYVFIFVDHLFVAADVRVLATNGQKMCLATNRLKLCRRYYDDSMQLQGVDC